MWWRRVRGCVRVLGVCAARSIRASSDRFSKHLGLCLSHDDDRAFVNAHFRASVIFFFFFASLHVCVCLMFLCAHTSLNHWQANRNPVCQVRLPKQSAIKPLTCSSRKPMLTAKVGANETRKCERPPEKHICVLMGVRKTLPTRLSRLCIYVEVRLRARDGAAPAGQAAGVSVHTCRYVILFWTRSDRSLASFILHSPTPSAWLR